MRLFAQKHNVQAGGTRFSKLCRRIAALLFLFVLISVIASGIALPDGRSYDVVQARSAPPVIAPFNRGVTFALGLRYAFDIFRGMLPVGGLVSPVKQRITAARIARNNTISSEQTLCIALCICVIVSAAISEMALSLGGHAPPFLRIGNTLCKACLEGNCV